MNYNQILGQRIKQHRENKNIPQKMLYYELNINKNTYCNIENGKSKISVEQLFSISKILDVSIFTLLNLDSEKILAQNHIIVGEINEKGKIKFSIKKK